MKARGIVVGLALAAMVAACGSSGGKTPTAATGFIPPGTNSAPTEAPITPAAAPTTETPNELFQDWLGSGGLAILQSLSTDLTAVQTDSTNLDTTSLETDSVTLKADVDKAQLFKPIPVPAAQAEYAASLSDLADAAQDYITGTANTDGSYIEMAGTSLDDGTSHLKVVTQLVGDGS